MIRLPSARLPPRLVHAGRAVRLARNQPAIAALGSLLAAVVVLLDLPMLIRLPVGLIGALALPGYAWSMALFPGPAVDRVGRWFLGGSLSLALLILVAPILDATGLGITPRALVLTLTGLTLLGAGIGARRRPRDPSHGRSSNARWEPHGVGGAAADRISVVKGWSPLTFLLLAALLLGGMAAALFARPPVLTEFFVLGEEGFADSYATSVEPEDPVTVAVGLTNREGSTLTYRVAASAGSSELAAIESISVEAGKTWTGDLTFSFPSVAPNQEVNIDLYRVGEEEPYRSLRLWIDVIDGG